MRSIAPLCLVFAFHSPLVAQRDGSTEGVDAPVASADLNEADWIGVYSSPSEIGGSTMLAVEKGLRRKFLYRMSVEEDTFSGTGSMDAIIQDELSGDVLIDGDRIYIPRAHGFYLDGKPSLLASVSRYTRMEINGQVVLMRDDALTAYRRKGQLYADGILFKVRDKAGTMGTFEDVQHKSMKLLPADSTHPGRD